MGGRKDIVKIRIANQQEEAEIPWRATRLKVEITPPKKRRVVIDPVVGEIIEKTTQGTVLIEIPAPRANSVSYRLGIELRQAADIARTHIQTQRTEGSWWEMTLAVRRIPDIVSPLDRLDKYFEK